MNCSEFENELMQLVESRCVALTDQAATHATECSACAERWREHRLIDIALAAWRPVLLPPSLADTVLAQLLAERSPVLMASRSLAANRSRWMVVAAAACLLAVLGFGMATIPSSGNRSFALRQDRSSSQQPSDISKQSSVEVVSSVAAVLDDLRTEYRELAAETRATAREFAVVIPPSPVVPWMNENNSDRAPENIADAVPPGMVSVIGRSIGTQIGQAMDFLWVTVPDTVPRG